MDSSVSWNDGGCSSISSILLQNLFSHPSEPRCRLTVGWDDTKSINKQVMPAKAGIHINDLNLIKTYKGLPTHYYFLQSTEFSNHASKLPFASPEQ